MEIIEIKNPDNQKQIEQFLETARRVYRNDPVWVPASDDIFRQRFAVSQDKTRWLPVLALDNDMPVARGVAILTAGALDSNGRPQGYVGFFECVSDHPSAGNLVLTRCENILREWGACSVQMPKLDNLIVGLVTKNFEMPQTIFTNHNPPYYPALIQQCGYAIQSKLYAFYFSRATIVPVQVARPGYSTREFNRQHLDDEVAIFHQLQPAIFGNRPGYVARTRAEDYALIQSLLPFMDDELVIIAEDNQKNPIGLLVCLPDIYQSFKGQKIDRARVILVGTIPRLTLKGIGALMGVHLLRNLMRKGYQSVEGSWVLENNILPQNLARRFKAEPGREFALFEKRL